MAAGIDDGMAPASRLNSKKAMAHLPVFLMLLCLAFAIVSFEKCWTSNFGIVSPKRIWEKASLSRKLLRSPQLRSSVPSEQVGRPGQECWPVGSVRSIRSESRGVPVAQKDL